MVSIDNPSLNSYSGGAVAAPIFAKIADSTLNYLGYWYDKKINVYFEYRFYPD